MGEERRPSRRSTRSITIAQVAEHAGVSAQTVSRAISKPDLVSPETAERVRASIRATGYVPNLAASHLASNRSNTVAVLIPTLSGSVFADMVQALDHVLAPHGFHLLIGTTGYSLEREEDALRAFLGRRPDGIVLAGTVHTPAARALLAGARVPVVETWETADDPIDSVVGFSNEKAMRALFDHVCDLGYRRPILAGRFSGGDVRALRRRSAFETAMVESLPDAQVRVFEAAGDAATLDTGRDLFERVRRDAPDADVMMFTSDVFASGALLAAGAAGVSVPGDIGVTGFGGFELGRHLTPPLTTVSVPNGQIGEHAGRALLERIGAVEPVAPANVDVGFSLVRGGSVAVRPSGAG